MKVFVERMPLGWVRIYFKREYHTIELLLDSDAAKNLYNDLASVIDGDLRPRRVAEEGSRNSQPNSF